MPYPYRTGAGDGDACSVSSRTGEEPSTVRLVELGRQGTRWQLGGWECLLCILLQSSTSPATPSQIKLSALRIGRNTPMKTDGKRKKLPSPKTALSTLRSFLPFSPVLQKRRWQPSPHWHLHNRSREFPPDYVMEYGVRGSLQVQDGLQDEPSFESFMIPRFIHPAFQLFFDMRPGQWERAAPAF